MVELEPIRILTVEDHPVFREGLGTIIGSQKDMRLVAQATNAVEAMAEFRRHRPDITLMDLRLPGTNGTDALVAIRGEFPRARHHADDLGQRRRDPARDAGGCVGLSAQEHAQGRATGLRKDGYAVTIVQNPTLSLADDVAVTRRALAAQNGPAILVGHSYGGAVITEAGNDPKVAGLVYVAAFAPDKGESVSSLIKDPAPAAPVPPILPPQDGFLFLDKAKFPASFAGDVNPEAAAFMADSQVPWGVEALSGKISAPAWRTKPSWYLVSTEDRMIPPDAQRAMSKRAGATVVEVKGSHAIYVSQPDAVASLIAKAAKGAELAAAAR